MNGRVWIGHFLPLVLCGVVGCSGCTDTTQYDPAAMDGAKPFAGRKLELVVPAGVGFSTSWDLPVKEWAEQTGADYRIVEYGLTQENRPLAELLGHASSETANRDAAVFVFPITQVAELAADGLLASIPKEVQTTGNEQTADSLDWIDFFKGLRENAASVEGKPTIIPISSPVLVCYYRRDLLDGVQFSPPKTWDEYQQLLDSLHQWAPGLTAVEPWGEEFRATLFLARAVSSAKHPANFSLFFNINTGKPLIDSPGFVRALQRAKKALAKMPTAVKGYSPADCRREFFSGKAAMAITFETGPGNPQVPFGPVSRRQKATSPETDSVIGRPELMVVGFSRLPGDREVYNLSTKRWESGRNGLNHVALTAYSGLCAGVSANCTPQQAQAAWNLLGTLTRDHLTVAFPGATKSPCRASQIFDVATWVGDDLSASESQDYLDVVTESLRDMRLVAELPLVGRDAFRAALTEGIGQALSQEVDAQKALNAVAQRWRKIADEIGRQKVHNSYRRSLGLRPR
jgi:ABC-type glycerol-3-phosphate transport system substrate-binding protein